MHRDGGPTGSSRYRCPRGHTRIRPSGTGYYCKTCRTHYDSSNIRDTYSR